MANNYFQFKQFTIHQERCAMKVTTDSCLFGAWTACESGPDTYRDRSSESGVRQLVLDIGTGTGLLSLMLTQQHPTAIIDAIEIDAEAYEQTRENIANSPWNQQVNTIHADIKQFQFVKQYDIIISNPPFYENELKSPDTKKNKALHDDGLQLDDLLTIIQQNLTPQGKFYLLLPYKRKGEVESLVAKNNLAITLTTLVKQSTQHNYFRIMLSGTHIENKKENPLTTEIAIKNERQEYTPAFIHLLKDYYLHL